MIGKLGSSETDDGDALVSVRPESILVVDAETRNQWVVETDQRTFDRLRGFDDADNEYVMIALERYGDDIEVYREAALEALQSLVSGDESGLNEA